MKDFIYYAALIPDSKDGGYVVRFIDFPEAITQGENIKDALIQAADCLEEAIANRIVTGLVIPKPSSKKKKNQALQYAIPLRAQMAAKAALYIAIKEIGISKVELAKRIGCDEKEVRRLIDPRHSSKLSRIESALNKMGKNLIIRLDEVLRAA